MRGKDMTAIPMYVFTGFLESGKTRFIQQTRKFVEHGKYLQKIMSPEALTLTGL